MPPKLFRLRCMWNFHMVWSYADRGMAQLVEEDESDAGYALFMFRFEKSGGEVVVSSGGRQVTTIVSHDMLLARLNASRSGVSRIESGYGFGFGFEMKKMKRGMLKRVKSLSCSSLSSVSSGGGSVEWESVTESESKGSSVDLPPGCKPFGYRWIFKRKMKDDGSIDKYKARKMKDDGSIDKYKTRLVIKGFRQKEGLDYFDTYSPVTRITLIRLVLAIVALRDLEVHQVDVKTSFLNENLEEEIYMEQPEGFSALGQEGKVCKLVKSLYGLKQAPKQWHQKFDQVMLNNGFKINECDKCVYVKNTTRGYVILCLYVDDILIVESDDKMIKSTKDMLKARFYMKDMGLVDLILGIKINRTQNGLVLNQSYYVDKILENFNTGDTSVAQTPVDTTQHLSKIESMTRLLRYLRYTRNYGLHYGRDPVVIKGCNDANWISNMKDSKSISGYVFTIGGAAIAWKSSKQTLIARCTMESEFIALDKAGEEEEWLRQFVEDVPGWPKPMSTICIHCDCQSAIGRAQSAMYNGKSRHIRRRHNTIRQLLSMRVISIDYVRSKDNVADPFTKGLSRELVYKWSRGMGLKPLEQVCTKENLS
ncbi:hypothetical protein E3N88_11981 [Mikania micrantha]|uniref:Reverse transcriptase Ty1/copia-type domain-containing protein n=1 Tax=Mikania micrantha TaxID=192012 RepID=A0A5N6P4J2_9ASTR|nr:hypothetical protein E3N88_11981 [Mikania micrantha]